MVATDSLRLVEVKLRLLRKCRWQSELGDARRAIERVDQRSQARLKQAPARNSCHSRAQRQSNLLVVTACHLLRTIDERDDIGNPAGRAARRM